MLAPVVETKTQTQPQAQTHEQDRATVVHAITLGTPYGCDPAHPVTPPDGCVGWSGYSDTGNSSLGSVDGQQHVAILLNGSGAPQYRWILKKLDEKSGGAGTATFEIDRPFATGTALAGSLVSVDVIKAQNIHVGNNNTMG